MSSFELQLRYCESAQRPASAVILEGSNPSNWLNEICAWELSLNEIDLFPLPHSGTDLRVRDVLVSLPKNAEAHRIPSLAAGYGWFGKRLLIPCEATLFPLVTEREVDELLSVSERISVWHPQRGLIGFEAADLLTLADLVASSQLARTDWSAAKSGTGINSRLHSIEAVWPESPEEIIKQAGQGIGSKGKDLSKLNPKGIAGKAVGVAGLMGGLALTPAALAAKMIQSVAPKSRQRAGGTQAPGQLESWASDILRNSAKLFDKRLREIDKLMKMLKESPDEGLKYAIPMGGEGTGVAGIAGASLMSRLVDFNLMNILGSGGGPTDYWAMPYEVQQELFHRYRELAEREVHLGRHRRAAYIYAELLGDFNGAASVLVAGKHYREAAVIYRDKLYRPKEAAECLENGGLFTDAIKIYRDLSMFEKVGDLYRKLHDEELAVAAYRRTAQSASESGNYLEAARILDEKIESPDEALGELKMGWKSSSRVKECLEKTFEIQARLGRHAETSSLIGELRDQRFSQGRAVAIVAALGTVVRNSPDAKLQVQAADASRVLVSRTIQSEPQSARQLLGLLEKLAPEDRLLKRDTARYLKQNRPQYLRRGSRKSRKKAWTATETSSQKINAPVREWEKFAQSGQTLIALGEGYQFEPVIVVGTLISNGSLIEYTVNGWGDEVSFRTDTLDRVGRGDNEHFSQIAFMPQQNTIHVIHADYELGSTGVYVPGSTEKMTAGTPAWLTDETVNIAGSSGVLWAVEVPSLALKGFNSTGLPVTNHQLEPPHDWRFDPAVGIPMLAKENSVYVALGSSLLQMTQSGRTRTIEFDQPILRLVGSLSQTLSRVGVLFENGGAVCWPSSINEPHVEPLPKNLSQPDGIFLRNGKLIIFASGEWHVYSMKSRELEFLGYIYGITHKPAQILRHPDPDKIIVCTTAGELVQYTLQES